MEDTRQKACMDRAYECSEGLSFGLAKQNVSAHQTHSLKHVMPRSQFTFKRPACIGWAGGRQSMHRQAQSACELGMFEAFTAVVSDRDERGTKCAQALQIIGLCVLYVGV